MTILNRMIKYSFCKQNLDRTHYLAIYYCTDGTVRADVHSMPSFLKALRSNIAESMEHSICKYSGPNDIPLSVVDMVFDKVIL